MADRIIAIGDIHGCSRELDALIQAIMPGPADTIITLGDYIDRGPDSCGVVEEDDSPEARVQSCPATRQPRGDAAGCPRRQ